jgi:hypothetical protein
MNEMRKLMEAVSQVELTENTGHIIADIENIYEEMDMLIDNLGSLIRQLPNERMREMGRRGVLSHFQMALNNNHDWLGKNMTTLEDFLNMLQEMESDPGYMEEGDEPWEDETEDDGVYDEDDRDFRRPEM